MGKLGSGDGELGILIKGLSHDEAALALAREVGNRRLEGNTLCNLGLLHQVQGNFADALAHLSQLAH